MFILFVIINHRDILIKHLTTIKHLILKNTMEIRYYSHILIFFFNNYDIEIRKISSNCKTIYGY